MTMNTRGRGTAAKSFGAWQKPRDDFDKVMEQLLSDVQHKWEDADCNEFCKWSDEHCEKSHAICIKDVTFDYDMVGYQVGSQKSVHPMFFPTSGWWIGRM